MPRILITTDGHDGRDPQVLLEESVVPAHFESEHFSQRLVERVGWAVIDAHEHDRDQADR